jgi:hypothetical protein
MRHNIAHSNGNAPRQHYVIDLIQPVLLDVEAYRVLYGRLIGLEVDLELFRAGYVTDVLRGEMAFFVVVLGDVLGVGAVLICDYEDVLGSAAGQRPRRRNDQNEKSDCKPSRCHHEASREPKSKTRAIVQQHAGNVNDVVARGRSRRYALLDLWPDVGYTSRVRR